MTAPLRTAIIVVGALACLAAAALGRPRGGAIPDHIDEDGSGYPTSGPATAGTTGLDFIEGGTHTSNAPPSGSVSNGTIQGADGAAMSLRLTNAQRRFLDDDYHFIRFWVKAGLTGARPTSGSATLMHVQAASVDRIGLTLQWINAKPDFPDYRSGIGLYFADNAGMERHLRYGDGNQAAGQPVIGFDTWAEVTYVVKRRITAGWAGVFVNGALVSETSGHNTAAYTELADDASWTIALPANSGIQWEIAPPFKSWAGNLDEVISPRHELQPAVRHQRMWMAPMWQAVEAPAHGMQLQMDDFTSVSLVNSTLANKHRYYLVSTTSQRTAASRFVLGTPQYGPTGWCAIGCVSLLRNGTEAFTLALRDAADSADVVSVTIDAGDEVTEAGGTGNPLITAIPSGWCGMFIHLHSSGEAWVSVQSMSADWHAAGPTMWKARLSDWIPQALGPVRMSVTATAGSPGIGPMGMWSQLGVVLVDSHASNSDAGDRGRQNQEHNNLSERCVRWQGQMGIPGGPVDYGPRLEARGLSPIYTPIIAARSGGKLTQFDVNGPDEAVPPGSLGILIDGGAVNDLATIDDGDDSIVLANLEASLRSLLDALTSSGGTALLSTVSDRSSLTASWTAQERAAAIKWMETTATIAAEYGVLLADLRTVFAIDQTSNPDGLYGNPSVHIGQDCDGDYLWWEGVIDTVESATANCIADITGPGGPGHGDGSVDALDFLLLVAQWGSPCAGTCEGDIIGPAETPDGNVDALDFLRLMAEWGSPANCG